jgi:hypothetical protein
MFRLHYLKTQKIAGGDKTRESSVQSIDVAMLYTQTRTGLQCALQPPTKPKQNFTRMLYLPTELFTFALCRNRKVGDKENMYQDRPTSIVGKKAHSVLASAD